MFRFLLLVLVLSCVLAEKDFYAILGVGRDADAKAIKKAFRKLSIKYHPDKAQGDKEGAKKKFEEISEAYEVLNNPDKRQIYDIDGEQGLKEGGRPRRGNSIFDFFGGGGGGGGGRRKGPNFEMKMDIALEDMYNGAEREFSISRKVLCKACRGTGAQDGQTIKCKKCKGKGQVMKLQQLGPGFNVQMQSTCEACGGRGNKAKNKCTACKGRKLVQEDAKLQAVVERGMPDGHKLVFERQSEQSPDTTPGDVIVRLNTRKHSRFRRDGNDLHFDQTISLKEALLGYEKSIRQLDGRDIVIKSQKITSHGDIMTVPDEGMPHHNYPSDKGNLYVHFSIAFPNRLSEAQKAAVKELLPN